MCGLNCEYENQMGHCRWDWAAGNPDPPGECHPRVDYIRTLHLYYDIPTLRGWISKYNRLSGDKQIEQLQRWCAVLGILEGNVPKAASEKGLL